MSEIYRDYMIIRRWITRETDQPQFDEWEYVHEDYDGPGDPRCGYARSLGECREKINDLEDEGA